MLRGDLRPIKPELDLHVDAIARIFELALYRVPGGRAGVGNVVRTDIAARLEGIEADLAIALPFSHVDLWWPPRDGREPECGPRTLCYGGDEGCLEVQSLTLGDGEVLLSIDRAGGIGIVASSGVVRDEGQYAAADYLVRLRHLGGAIVRCAPRVVVREVLLER